MLPDRAARPNSTDLEPGLTVDATVELLPERIVQIVDAVEVIPTVRTQEFVVPANDSLEEQEMRSLYADDGVLAQLRLPDPPGVNNTAFPDGIEITVDHGGEESPRFNLKNSRGFFDNSTPEYGEGAPQTELWVWEDTDLFFNIENTTGSEVTFTLEYTGWAYKLSDTNEDPDVTVLTERFSLRQ